MHNLHKYEFPFEFDVPATYPTVSPELKIPELENKTAKMYRGGAICLTVHFKPLWAKNRRAGFIVALAAGLPLPMSLESSHLVAQQLLSVCSLPAMYLMSHMRYISF